MKSQSNNNNVGTYLNFTYYNLEFKLIKRFQYLYSYIGTIGVYNNNMFHTNA